MEQYIPKSALVSEIERLHKAHSGKYGCDEVALNLEYLEDFIDTLEVIDPYEQCIQYPTVKDGIEAHAEVYSFNIESELFNQLTKEQQKLWRKEIEQSYISGGNAGYLLATDPRYKENLEVKEVDLDFQMFAKEMDNVFALPSSETKNTEEEPLNWEYAIAKHFYSLRFKEQKGEWYDRRSTKNP